MRNDFAPHIGYTRFPFCFGYQTYKSMQFFFRDFFTGNCHLLDQHIGNYFFDRGAHRFNEQILDIVSRRNRAVICGCCVLAMRFPNIPQDRVNIVMHNPRKIIQFSNLHHVQGSCINIIHIRMVFLNDLLSRCLHNGIHILNPHIGDTVNEPVIASLCRREGLDVNIVGANISPMQGSMMSVFILQLIGDSEQINAAEAYIDKSGAIRKRLIIDWENRTVTETA